MEDHTNITEVFCLGDGYAHGHIWPEWPQILQALRPDLKVTIISAVGAGHEFLISQLLEKNVNGSLVIFQWPYHRRFDKLIQDSNWESVLQLDPLYSFNTYKTSQGTWWCSSGSKTKVVKHYHDYYVQDQQSALREKNQKILIESYLKQCARYVCTSTDEQDIFARDQRFSKFRGHEIQPAPLLHYHWLIESIIPRSKLTIDIKRSQELGNRISSHQWIPYDPDREEIWNNMSKDLVYNP